MTNAITSEAILATFRKYVSEQSWGLTKHVGDEDEKYRSRLLLDGVGVTTFREYLADTLNVSTTEAKRLCGQAVEAGELTLRGNGSARKYADTEVVEREKERKADIARRREAAVAALNELGIDATLARSWTHIDLISLPLEAAEALVERLRA